MPSDQDEERETEIAVLEARLHALKTSRVTNDSSRLLTDRSNPDAALHSLLLLADSSLPLGSFAFSAGLESFLAHSAKQTASQNTTRFRHFLKLSVESLAALTLPYVYRAWLTPKDILDLDNILEASTTCTVNKRASVAQGRALLTMWQRSFRPTLVMRSQHQVQAAGALHEFFFALSDMDPSGGRPKDQDEWSCVPQAHFAPLFGVLGALMDVPLRQIMYIYLLNHAKMVLSAAIRASVIGPYQSQSELASEQLRCLMAELTDRQFRKAKEPGDAGQAVPAMDIWSGRHELVYSRIFNS